MKNIARVCGVLIVIAYFLPWMSMVFASISGFTIGKMAITKIAEGGGTLWALPSLLFVVLGIASAVVNNKRGHLASGVYVLLIVIWILVDMAGGTRGSFSEVIGIGLWITLVAAIGQIGFAEEAAKELGEPSILRILLVVGSVAILVLIMNFMEISWLEDRMDQLKDYLEDHFWKSIWKFVLLFTCGLFAILSVLVTVGGALDVRKLLHRLREREASGDPDSAD